MNKYDIKRENITRHLEQHPTDIQAVQAFFRYNSDSIVYERNQAKIDMKRRIATCRRKEREKKKRLI